MMRIEIIENPNRPVWSRTPRGFRPVTNAEWARMERARKWPAPIRPVRDPEATAERPTSWRYTFLREAGTA